MKMYLKNKILRTTIISAIISISCNFTMSFANEASTISNPILPGYFADPSAYRFGDAYYIYATSDGFNVNQTGGWPVVWKSKDFINWEASRIDVIHENGTAFDLSSFYWAPSALEHNGKYYLFFTYADYYTQIAVSDTPDGEFTSLGNLFDTSEETRPYNKTIDSQVFKDDDGKVYITYLLNPDPEGDHRIWTAIAELDPDNLLNVLKIRKLEEIGTDYKEGQEIIKHGDKYYLLYSQGWWRDDSYHVKYALSDDIWGPYEIKDTILRSPNEEINGTGHHSTIKVDDKYYIVYHRNFHPWIGPGFRQTCVNEMEFDEDGKILEVRASHVADIPALGSDERYTNHVNIAETAVIVSQHYGEKHYAPENILDNSNRTLWKTKDDKYPYSIVLDLQDEKAIERTELFFEYPSKYYQYTIEHSNDNSSWRMYSDMSSNIDQGTPMRDVNKDNVSARYLRLTITGTQRMLGDAYGFIDTGGLPAENRRTERAGLWQFKVYSLAP